MKRRVYADNYSGKAPGAAPAATSANTGAVATAASPQNGAPAAAPLPVPGGGGSSGAGASGTGAAGPSLDDIPMYVDDMGVAWSTLSVLSAKEINHGFKNSKCERCNSFGTG